MKAIIFLPAAMQDNKAMQCKGVPLRGTGAGYSSIHCTRKTSENAYETKTPHA